MRKGPAGRFAVHVTPFEMHVTRFEVHVPPFEVHVPPFEVHDPPFEVHDPPFEVHATPFEVHTTRFEMQVTRFEVHVTLFIPFLPRTEVRGYVPAPTRGEMREHRAGSMLRCLPPTRRGQAPPLLWVNAPRRAPAPALPSPHVLRGPAHRRHRGSATLPRVDVSARLP